MSEVVRHDTYVGNSCRGFYVGVHLESLDCFQTTIKLISPDHRDRPSFVQKVVTDTEDME